ncbi:butyrate kinase [Candidatus Eisenbacteria bacterium]|uniref:Probable butyrate kinase n=1 Tax=Eiseniibacteriota bacterium TaxID=2212470 RepID=A0ABV6YMV8_UNCEI
MFRVLVINPGGGSTKVAVCEDADCVLTRSIAHPHDEVARFDDVFSQREYRERAIEDFLTAEGIDLKTLDAVVGRGGALKPLESGTYRVNKTLIEDIKAGRVQAQHASNLGPIIAYDIAESIGKPAFIVDPVSVDEFTPEARISGLPELERKSLDHPLNSKMVAREAARELGGIYQEMNFIIAHLGTGISISAHERGRAIDVNNAQDGGPFSTQRAGGLPTTLLVDLCYSGKLTRDEMFTRLTRSGGMMAYLGTDDMAKAVEMAVSGDEKARLVISAMAYQIAKEIGASAAVLKGKVDAIVFTGGMANSDYLVNLVKERVGFITPNVFVYPGEHEMESLALGALRVLKGEEEPRQYR